MHHLSSFSNSNSPTEGLIAALLGPPSSFLLLLLLELLLAGGGDGGGGVAKAMSAAPKETKRREREDEGDRSKRKRHREERQAVQAAGEEQARKALQEKAPKEREANEQLDEFFRMARRLQPEPPQCPDSWLNTTPPPPPPQDPAPQDPPPPQQRNSRVSEGKVNDQDQDFQRQLALVQEEKAEDHKRRPQRACQHRLLVQLLVVLLLLCFVLGVLPQHYFPMDVSTDIFPTRAFQMRVSGVHAGVWCVFVVEKVSSDFQLSPTQV